MPPKRDFAAEVAALQASKTHGPERAYELCELNEAWASSLARTAFARKPGRRSAVSH
jgi:hypothetical protein